MFSLAIQKKMWYNYIAVIGAQHEMLAVCFQLSDEFLYSMGGGDEDADWERWKFKTDEQTRQTVFLPA